MIVGIDLGTTNSLVAYYTEEGPKIIPNRLGKHLTPSVVSVDENDEIWVGETAMERSLLYPDTVAQVFKRSMGTGKKSASRLRLLSHMGCMRKAGTPVSWFLIWVAEHSTSLFWSFMIIFWRSEPLPEIIIWAEKILQKSWKKTF